MPPRRAASDRFRRSPFCMKIRILGKNPWHPSRRIGSDAALFACGRKRPTNGNGKLVRPVSEARCGERCEHGRAAGFRNGKGIGVRNAAFRAPRASAHSKLQVIQGFGSPNVSGRSRLRTAQGFGSSKDSGRPRLRVAQISGFQSSLMKNRKKKKGGIGLFRPSNSTSMSKKRCLENFEHHFCCIHNETALNRASFRCNNNLCIEKIPL